MTPGATAVAVGFTLAFLIGAALVVLWWSLTRRVEALEALHPAVVQGKAADEPATDEFPAVVESEAVIAHPASTRLRWDELLRPTPYPRTGRHRAQP